MMMPEKTLFSKIQSLKTEITDVNCKLEKSIPNHVGNKELAVFQNFLEKQSKKQKSHKKLVKKLTDELEESQKWREIQQFKIDSLQKEIEEIKDTRISEINNNEESEKPESLKILKSSFSDFEKSIKCQQDQMKKRMESIVAKNESIRLEIRESRRIQKKQNDVIVMITQDMQNIRYILRQKIALENAKIQKEIDEIKNALKKVKILPETPEENAFEIMVIAGKDIPLEVRKIDKIADVKAKIVEKSKIPLEILRLTYGGHILQDNFTIADYKIQPKSRVYAF
ncbi:hypothetical protein L5515_015292 [Caenorhabditis briggsae]|uniref:Ubiquitin-like domain-containing protein n=1 Tax=Caenorhabditis briggsae TaxID=6238 RepID=A0AAE9J7Z3_CAEBR|nr:hypothetical protein L5515_015292 [Caenorhabditis briggsae]